MVRRPDHPEGGMIKLAAYTGGSSHAHRFYRRRSRQDNFQLVALGEQGKVVVRKKFFAQATAGLHRQPAKFADWHRGLLGSTLHRRSSAQPKTRRATYLGPVCEALREVEQERLPRCGSHRRGGGAAVEAPGN